MLLQKYAVPLFLSANILVSTSYAMDSFSEEQLENEVAETLSDIQRIEAAGQLVQMNTMDMYVQLTPVQHKRFNKRKRLSPTQTIMTTLLKKLFTKNSYTFDDTEPIDSLLSNLKNVELIRKILNLVTIKKPKAEMVEKITFAQPLSEDVVMVIREFIPKIARRGCSKVFKALLEKQGVAQSLDIKTVIASIKNALKGSGIKKHYYIITQLISNKDIYALVNDTIDKQPELFDGIFIIDDIKRLNNCQHVTSETQKLLKRLKRLLT